MKEYLNTSIILMAAFLLQEKILSLFSKDISDDIIFKILLTALVFSIISLIQNYYEITFFFNHLSIFLE
jgi:putative effector of murein hydrolase LrgA (UPF0299 family)